MVLHRALKVDEWIVAEIESLSRSRPASSEIAFALFVN
jgi:hypothetical protein